MSMYSIRIYLSANLTAQRSITNWARLEKKKQNTKIRQFSCLMMMIPLTQIKIEIRAWDR
jgi:hypothetical protein